MSGDQLNLDAIESDAEAVSDDRYHGPQTLESRGIYDTEATPHRLNSCPSCRDWGKWERHEDHAGGPK